MYITYIIECAVLKSNLFVCALLYFFSRCCCLVCFVCLFVFPDSFRCVHRKMVINRGTEYTSNWSNLQCVYRETNRKNKMKSRTKFQRNRQKNSIHTQNEWIKRVSTKSTSHSDGKRIFITFTVFRCCMFAYIFFVFTIHPQHIGF